jgi:CRISPR/Cas system-associated endoribonuclease Cas2
VPELITLVIYDVEDDWARTRVSEACKDFGLQRIQYSCFRGKLSQNKREELYERMRRVQRDWEIRWRKDFPESRIQREDSPYFPDSEPSGLWSPAFKIVIQPLCEKDVGSATYAYLFIDVPKADERIKEAKQKEAPRSDGGEREREHEADNSTQPDATSS